MVRALVVLLLGSVLAAPASAFRPDWGGGWSEREWTNPDWSTPGWPTTGWHGGWHGGRHSIGWGWRWGNPDEKFDDRFSDLQMDYDDGLANIEDYYNSDEYTEVVSDLEHLLGKHDWYLEGVEGSVDHYDQLITWTNDKITRIEEKLADLDSDKWWHERYEQWLTKSLEHVESHLDKLTEKQSDKEEQLSMVTEFNDELSTYLEEVKSAGMGETMVEAEDFGVLSTSSPLLPLTAPTESVILLAPRLEGSASVASISVAPEPAALILLLGGGLLTATRRRR